jgi:hypothetical protein
VKEPAVYESAFGNGDARGMQHPGVLLSIAEYGPSAAKNTLKQRDLGHGAAAASAYGSGGWGFESLRGACSLASLVPCSRESSHPRVSPAARFAMLGGSLRDRESSRAHVFGMYYPSRKGPENGASRDAAARSHRPSAGPSPMAFPEAPPDAARGKHGRDRIFSSGPSSHQRRISARVAGRRSAS